MNDNPITKRCAVLECIELYNKETKLSPKFRLTYEDKVWEFREGNRGAASQQAGWYLNELVFGIGDPVWYHGIDKEKIPYRWKDDSL